MKVLLILFLLCQSAFGFDMVAGGAGVCHVDRSEVGHRTVGASDSTGSAGYMVCSLFTPDCSGNVYSAYAYHRTTDSESIRLYIYLDDTDEAPDSGDSLVAASGVISSAAVEWATSTMSTHPAVSTANKYWICQSRPSGTGWTYKHDTGLTQYSEGSRGAAYTTPPDTLAPVASWGSTANVKPSMYITIGD